MFPEITRLESRVTFDESRRTLALGLKSLYLDLESPRPANQTRKPQILRLRGRWLLRGPLAKPRGSVASSLEATVGYSLG